MAKETHLNSWQEQNYCIMNYLVEIKEYLSKQINVTANSEEEAINQVKKLYLESQIVLNSGDFIEYEIDTIKD